MGGDVGDLAEHIAIVVILAGVGWTLFWWAFRRQLLRLEEVLDALSKVTCDCQASLPKEYARLGQTNDEFESVWKALNKHGHSPDGRVTR